MRVNYKEFSYFNKYNKYKILENNIDVSKMNLNQPLN